MTVGASIPSDPPTTNHFLFAFLAPYIACRRRREKPSGKTAYCAFTFAEGERKEACPAWEEIDKPWAF